MLEPSGVLIEWDRIETREDQGSRKPIRAFFRVHVNIKQHERVCMISKSKPFPKSQSGDMFESQSDSQI